MQEHAGEVYPQLEATSKAVAEGVAAEAARAGVPLTTNRVGSMWTWFFTPGPVTNYEQAARSDTAAFGRFHRAMLDRGIWLPPSQFEAAFISTAHGDAEVQATIAAAREAFQSEFLSDLVCETHTQLHASTVTNRCVALYRSISIPAAVTEGSRFASGSR